MPYQPPYQTPARRESLLFPMSVAFVPLSSWNAIHSWLWVSPSLRFRKRVWFAINATLSFSQIPVHLENPVNNDL